MLEATVEFPVIQGARMRAYSDVRTGTVFSRALLVFMAVLCAYGVVFSGAAVAQVKAKEAGPKIYHVPASKIKAHIEKTKGRKKVLFIWRSDDEFSRRFVPEYSTLEKASPGSVISIATDKSPTPVLKYLNSIGESHLKTLVVKRVMGDEFNSMLSDLGIKTFSEYPLVVTLDEENVVQEQGKLFVDYVADFLFTDKRKKVQAP